MGLVPNQVPKDLSTSDGKIYLKADSQNPQYWSEINLLYRELRKYCSKLDYCFDISDKVNPNGNNYKDKRHLNEIGNKKLASTIMDVLNSRYNISN